MEVVMHTVKCKLCNKLFLTEKDINVCSYCKPSIVSNIKETVNECKKCGMTEQDVKELVKKIKEVV